MFSMVVRWPSFSVRWPTTRPARPASAPRTVPRQALVEALAAVHEHGMVRHEAAIALGHLGTPQAEVALRPGALESRGQVARTCQLRPFEAEFSWDSQL